jgi:hypothetical protein
MKCNVKDCNKDAEYQQNQYTELCFKHFFKCVEGMLIDWRENNFRTTVWMFNRDKVIKK